MITSERLLKIISLLILISTIIFTAFTVISEMMKPEDRFERIVQEYCPNGYSGLDREESTQELSEQDCIFINSEKLRSPALHKYEGMRNVDGFDRLFIGSRGILLKKNRTDYQAPAASIIKCIRKGECSHGGTGSKYTVTIEMKDSSGRLSASVSYVDTELSQISRNSRKLLADIVKLKNGDMNTLRTLIYFHHPYTFIENKSPENTVSMMKKGLDGLYLESRGAKIRVLPDEYSSNDPFDLLDKKGKQYGLEKEEYKKDEASVFIYRTSQFIEHNGEMVPFFINAKKGKKDLSDKISSLFIIKHLKNIQEPSGRFISGLEIFSAKETEEQDSNISQAYAAMALFKLSVQLNDPSLKEMAVRSYSYISGIGNKSEELKAFEIILRSICKEECPENGEMNSFADSLKKIETVKTLSEAHPLSTGTFINAALSVRNDPAFEAELAELLRSSVPKTGTMKTKDKVIYTASIASISVSDTSVMASVIKQYLEDNSAFLDSIRFDDRNFGDMSGSITLKQSAERPETALSIVLASGLSSADAKGMSPAAASKLSADAGLFIKNLIVTDDDFPAWGSTSAKQKVQGGIRAFPGSAKIRLFNTARALNYFSNRISIQR